MKALSQPILDGRRPSRRRLRRLSRRYGGVGVDVSADRLAQIAAGYPATEGERVDVAFAETATRILAESRRARRGREKRRCVHSAVVIGGTVVALTILLGLGLTFFLMAEHISPF